MYEKQLIAAMNNFEAAKAWKCAVIHRQGYDRVFGYWREAHRKYDTAVDAGYGLQEQIKTLQKELCASREENRALHEELGDIYEANFALAKIFEAANTDAENCRALVFAVMLWVSAICGAAGIFGWGSLLATMG